MKINGLILFATFPVFVVLPPALLAQGSLAPAGPPAPTMKSLDQVEPRTPISSVPFVITNPGSYYLTTNLTDTAGTNGIIVQADDVSIDLQGFALSGSGGFSASSSGVFTGLTNRSNLEIRNGTIRNWAYDGIRAGQANNSRFENLRLYNNADEGINVGNGCIIEKCEAQANGGIGMYVADNSVIKDCTSVSNMSYGLDATKNCVIKDCVVSLNRDVGIGGYTGMTVRGCSVINNQGAGILTAGYSTVADCTVTTNGQTGFFKQGIRAGPYSTVSRCTVVGNYGDGIDAQDGSTVEDCTSGLNATNGIQAAIGSTIRNCTLRLNGDDGIEVPNDCLVLDNHCSGNGQSTATGAGIHTTVAGNRIEGNSVIFNKRGLWIDGALNLVIRNSSRYNPDGTGSANFVVAGSNIVGPTNVLGAGVLTNSNPWANISY